MQNQQLGKSTELKWTNYRFREGMTARLRSEYVEASALTALPHSFVPS